MIHKFFSRATIARSVILGIGFTTAGTLVPGELLAAPVTPHTPGPVGSASLAGKTIFLDPGHQGAATPRQLNKQVSDGRGATKACQTAGATSIHHIPEHTINWNVAQYLKNNLEAQGARVLLSRQNDTGWGGCITDRAEAANRSGADLAISLHADSSSKQVDPTKSGFHLIVPTLPIADPAVNQVQATRGLQASKDIRDSLKAAGFKVSNYINTDDGLSTRFDIAGPALTKVPLAFVEMGNLSNPHDAMILESSTGQQRYAKAVSMGAADYIAHPDGHKAQDNNAPMPVTPSQTTDPAQMLTELQNFLNRNGASSVNNVNNGANGSNPLSSANMNSIADQISKLLNNDSNGLTNNNGLNLGGNNSSGLDLTSLVRMLKNIPGSDQLINVLRNVPVLGQAVNDADNNSMFPAFPQSNNNLFPPSNNTTPTIPLLTPPGN